MYTCYPRGGEGEGKEETDGPWDLLSSQPSLFCELQTNTSFCLKMDIQGLHAHVHLNVHTHTHTHARVHTRSRAHMRAHTCARTHVHIHKKLSTVRERCYEDTWHYILSYFRNPWDSQKLKHGADPPSRLCHHQAPCLQNCDTCFCFYATQSLVLCYKYTRKPTSHLLKRGPFPDCLMSSQDPGPLT